VLEKYSTTESQQFGGGTHHDVHNKNSNITEGATTRAQVREGFVTRSIDDQETWDLVFL
jgi:hypothetical protein